MKWSYGEVCLFMRFLLLLRLSCGFGLSTYLIYLAMISLLGSHMLEIFFLYFTLRYHTHLRPERATALPKVTVRCVSLRWLDIVNIFQYQYLDFNSDC